MVAAWIGVSACVAQILFTEFGLTAAMRSRLMRGRLRGSTLEILYSGGTVLLAATAGAVVFATLGMPPSVLDTDPWSLAAPAVLVSLLALIPTPRPSLGEPSRARRLLLCFGGAGEEVLWRGVGIASTLHLGIEGPWAHMLATAGFVFIHLERYGRRGIGFIAVFSVMMTCAAWLFGLMAVITIHVCWNALMALRRRKTNSVSSSVPATRGRVDDW